MSSGRYFAEKTDSYKRTGVPCGNPRRYQCNDVMRMNSGQSASKRTSCVGPEEEIETEAQRHLQTLLRKQLDTQTTLEKELHKKKEFSGGQGFKPLSSDISGISSLSSYSDIVHKDSYLQELKQCGLTDEEISFKLGCDQQNNEKSKAKRARIQIDPKAQEQKLNEINHKIDERNANLSKADTFSGTVGLSRHEMDLEKALTQNSSDKSQYLNKLLMQKPSEKTIHPDHPLNHISLILDDISKATNDEVVQSSSQINDDEDSEDDVNVFPGCLTLDEFKEAYKDSSHPYFKNEENSKASIELVPEEVIEKNRLTQDEIRQLPRFSGYNAGSPSRVLYLKNLCNKVTKEDLMSLFLRFEEKDKPEVVFKLLTGRMRGQAFVTFPDCETAETAMNLVNGYVFKGKPVIIEYGKKPND